jgi:hypothetical protein
MALQPARSTGDQESIWIHRISDLALAHQLVSDLHVVSSPHPLIRVGARHDGGYLLPDDLDGIGACVSPGVGSRCDFDLAIAERGIRVHMADASVAGPPRQHPRFHFSRCFLDSYNSDNTITLEDFARNIAAGRDLLLQMDIEGAEWHVLNAASSAVLDRFRIMVVEFHDMPMMFTRFGYRQINAVFRKLLKTHAIVHIHPNSVGQRVVYDGLEVPSILEFTFQRRDRGAFGEKTLTFPHLLDATNQPTRPDYVLPGCWYK